MPISRRSRKPSRALPLVTPFFFSKWWLFVFHDFLTNVTMWLLQLLGWRRSLWMRCRVLRRPLFRTRSKIRLLLRPFPRRTRRRRARYKDYHFILVFIDDGVCSFSIVCLNWFMFSLSLYISLSLSLFLSLTHPLSLFLSLSLALDNMYSGPHVWDYRRCECSWPRDDRCFVQGDDGEKESIERNANGLQRAQGLNEEICMVKRACLFLLLTSRLK